MNKYSFFWIIVLISVVLFGAWLLASQPHPSTSSTQMTVTGSSVPSSTAPALNPPAATAPTSSQAMSTTSTGQTRAALGPLVSPDGLWRLEVRETGDPKVSLEHALVARRVGSGVPTVLYRESEKANADQSSSLGTHHWSAAGWSADGRTAYYASSENSPFGAGFPPPVVYGNDLYAVNVKTALANLALTLPKGDTLLGNGLADVSVLQNKVLQILNGKLFIEDLTGNDRHELTVNTGQPRDQIHAAIFSPDAGKIGLVMARFGDQGTGPARWFFGLLNLSDGVYTQYSETTPDGFQSWRSNSTASIKVVKNGQTLVQDIVVP